MTPMEILQMMQQAMSPLQNAIQQYAASGAELKGKMDAWEEWMNKEMKRLHSKDLEHDQHIAVFSKALAKMDGFKEAFKEASKGINFNLNAENVDSVDASTTIMKNGKEN